MVDGIDTPLRATAVVLAYGAEDWLEPCLDALLQSRGITLDIVLVDNGCTNSALAACAERDGVSCLRPPANLGFAGGCNFGAAQAKGDVLVLVNSDAIVEPDAIAALAWVAMEPAVGIATCSLRLADAPGTLNSAGNPVHVSGLTWAGHFGEPATRYADRREVPTATGAACALRTELWNDLGGFAPEYFAYLEDTELSLRCWQRGLSVVYVPDAVVLHHYEFSRTARKYELLERNRHVLLLTLFERRTLLLLAPALLLVEVALIAMSLAQGWFGSKVRALRWVLTHRRFIRERHRQLQAERRVPDGELARLFTPRLDPANVGVPAAARVLDLFVSAWWALVRPALRHGH